MRRFLLFFSMMVLGSYICGSGSCVAQSNDDEEYYPTPIPGYVEDPKDPYTPPDEFAESELELIAPTPVPKNISRPILKHFRFDKGMEFTPGPSPTPMIDIQKFVEEGQKSIEEAAKDFPSSEELEKMIMAGLKPPILDKCSEDITESAGAPDDFPEGLEGERSPFLDLLFIDAKDVPPDAEQIFGAGNLIVPYSAEVPNMAWNLIEQMSVPCLPYRVRMQGSKVYFDKGMPALKNYGKSPKGFYHAFIQSKYGVKK